MSIKRYSIPFLFIAPSLVLFFVFCFIPIIAAFFASLTDWGLGGASFVGFGNYVELARDPLFSRSLKNTFYFTFVGVPLSVLSGLATAILLNSSLVRIKTLFRTGFFLPVVTNLVACGVVWRWLYNPQYGVIKWFLEIFHISSPNWLGDPKWAMPAIILMAIWRNFGYSMVIFLAGLQAIPRRFYEAAIIDGADSFKSFLHITLPLLKPTTVFVCIITTIGYFQLFAEPYIMTNQGGPVNSTLSVVLYLYKNGFKFFRFGYASAIAYVLFFLIFIFSLLQLRFIRHGVEY
ncbi:MAG: sugar ABC transporter permease [bacterium (Candidatus Stahlbacteria) CG23_combo_of_CG06-09_8_20_14_all_40_9]|nr:MAG: sugar ABC transporter permease [bacterium (Candidatus Stahlbacteria) CG23_combo_of_CG06-09_8_20_14_all_40_9]